MSGTCMDHVGNGSMTASPVAAAKSTILAEPSRVHFNKASQSSMTDEICLQVCVSATVDNESPRDAHSPRLGLVVC